MKLLTPPAFIEYQGMRFLVHDLPTSQTFNAYLKIYKKFNVTHVVRVCKCLYAPDVFEKNGVKVVDLPFDDGASPPLPIIKSWFDLVEEVFKTGDSSQTIAIHCVAGLGRAPVLVALAMLKQDKSLCPLDAITIIRRARRGAINAKQMRFIENFRKSDETQGCCNIL